MCSEKETFCVDKTVRCALELRNLDAEEMGSFSISFKFSDSETRNNVKNDEVTRFVYAQTTETFAGSVRVRSEGVDGDANKRWSCNYRVEDTPSKEMCRDVLKYKEIQKERQVTAYRPVTKHKTEEVCD